ncbi:metal ABC transporter ATP-binding protein [Fontivita pretiosa]|uniref:metal ABC transporter ATP-binding protein n=1 Tax=Fontivita pretiosa TaxID=2989684 RepID=UPI003D1663DF
MNTTQAAATSQIHSGEGQTPNEQTATRRSEGQAGHFVPALEVHDLTVSYHRKPVLWNVDLAIPPGRLVGIIGPNGAGKSTLIKAIMGLLPLSSGWVQVFGRPIEEQRQKIAYVPQRESVDWTFPVTAMDVVLMGRYGSVPWYRRIGRRDRERARQCLEKVGMLPYAHRQISNLSGGQQQRVFLARALAQDSEIYLMDEPFAGVDAATEAAIIKLLQELRAGGKTVLVVNHDLQTAKEYFDMLILLNMRLVAFGPTEQVFTPELLQKTYGGRLTILADVADAVADAELGVAKPAQKPATPAFDPPTGL